MSSVNVPAPAAYSKALASLLNRVPRSYVEMLKAHYHAREHEITARELAKAAGYRHYGAANLHYGRLARLIAELIGYRPDPSKNRQAPVWTSTLATGGGGDAGSGDFVWRMRWQVADALGQLRL